MTDLFGAFHGATEISLLVLALAVDRLELVQFFHDLLFIRLEVRAKHANINAKLAKKAFLSSTARREIGFRRGLNLAAHARGQAEQRGKAREGRRLLGDSCTYMRES